MKDLISCISHFIGAIASVVGLVFLVIWACLYGDTWNIVSFSIYGASLILLYSASTVYHWVKGEKVSATFRIVDHIMIYVLIAGTYTPIALGPLRGPWGWSIFGIVWGLTLLGIFFKLFWMTAPRWLSTSIYLGMGWVVVIAAIPMIKTFTMEALFWLILGGLFYTIGAVLYGLKWPKFKNKYFGFHELFHIFILLGSLSHYWFIINYVLYIK